MQLRWTHYRWNVFQWLIKNVKSDQKLLILIVMNLYFILNDSYVKMCVPDAIKNLNVKVFNLMSRTNEARHVEWHETCKYKCRLDAGVCNNKQRWNEDKCRCECKELIDKGVCDKGSIWNPWNCESECDESCDVVEYLDYENPGNNWLINWLSAAPLKTVLKILIK